MSWPIVPLKECARIVGGATPKSEVEDYWNGDIPWTTPKDISDLDGKFLNDTPRKITALGLRNCSSELLPPNSVLFSSRAPIGHVAINTVPMATNQGFKSMVPGPKLDASFLYWWLKCHRSQLERLGNGATFKEVSKAVVERIEIPLPPLVEQKRIAAILDQADDLRRKRQRALDRLGQLGQATFIEMFGDPATNPMGWLRVSLMDCCAQLDDIRCGPFGTQLLREEFRETGVPLWGIKQVNRGFSILTHEYVTPNKARELSNYDIVEDDIVMTRKGTIGNCAVYPKGFPSGIMHSDLLRVRLDQAKAAPQFVADQLHFSRDIQRQIELISGGAIMQGINVGKLKKIKILLPPLALQVKYAKRMTAVGIQISFMKKWLHSAEALFTSLQHRAFRSDLTTSNQKEAVV
jgi:type I restriction enzyme S subunit